MIQQLRPGKNQITPYLFTQLVAKWHTAGADIIGGCCTTATEQIEQIAAYFKDE